MKENNFIFHKRAGKQMAIVMNKQMAIVMNKQMAIVMNKQIEQNFSRL
jgi:hypothetical protein